MRLERERERERESSLVDKVDGLKPSDKEWLASEYSREAAGHRTPQVRKHREMRHVVCVCVCVCVCIYIYIYENLQ
jgi:hypothetical protein